VLDERAGRRPSVGREGSLPCRCGARGSIALAGRSLHRSIVWWRKATSRSRGPGRSALSRGRAAQTPSIAPSGVAEGPACGPPCNGETNWSQRLPASQLRLLLNGLRVDVHHQEHESRVEHLHALHAHSTDALLYQRSHLFAIAIIVFFSASLLLQIVGMLAYDY
jgi:hypothetical protein